MSSILDYLKRWFTVFPFSQFDNSDQPLIEAKTPDLKEFIDKMETLDIILFNGRDFWFSYLVEWTTWSKFSHIGIVLRSPTWLDPELTGDYFFESGIEPTPDAVTHHKIFGVQITPLATKLKNYDGQIYWRKIQSKPLQTNPKYYQEKLESVYKIVQDKPYDDELLDLTRVVLHVKLGNCRRTSKFFCSALVSFIFTQLGFLPTDTQWDLTEPKDYNQGNKIDQILKEHELCSLGPSVRIK